MSLGANTVTVTINSVDKVLAKINQTNFSSQYYLRESTQEFTLNVRHSQEGLQPDGTRFDRHNIEFIRTVFPSDTTPGITHTSYLVVRNSRRDDYEKVQHDTSGLIDFLDSSTVNQLLGWIN